MTASPLCRPGRSADPHALSVCSFCRFREGVDLEENHVLQGSNRLISPALCCAWDSSFIRDVRVPWAVWNRSQSPARHRHRLPAGRMPTPTQLPQPHDVPFRGAGCSCRCCWAARASSGTGWALRTAAVRARRVQAAVGSAQDRQAQHRQAPGSREQPAPAAGRPRHAQRQVRRAAAPHVAPAARQARPPGRALAGRRVQLPAQRRPREWSRRCRSRRPPPAR